ncbi:MAG: hypothetical protein EU548_00855 [Promethearchaeota archaeon]|nr:MAG: hypothetical protein EU548_00855 [Candidatus Lokiarchaeota archaeon]
MPRINHFKNKAPIQKGKKELIGLVFISLFLMSFLFYYKFVENTTEIPTNLPAVYIICEDEILIDDYVECVFSLNQESIQADIKIRGANNAFRAKKGYRIQLSEEKSFLGMREDDDWLLFALTKDDERLRTKLSFDLWRSLEDYNPTAILPDSRYVRVYMNGEFQGLYLLAEKNDRRLYGFDSWDNSIDSSLIFQVKVDTFLNDYNKDCWEQDYPNLEDINIMDEILTDLIFFINNSSDEEFFNPITGVYAKFDKTNLIDFFLYNFFILHYDFWYHNYFIIRNTNPSKFILIPWDFDASFGSFGTIRYDSSDNPESLIISKNQLYNRLLNSESFMKDCKDRWNYLREEVWTEDFIMSLLSDQYEEIEDIIEIELNLWETRLTSKKDFDLNKHVSRIFNWIPERIDFCDNYFASI